MVCVGKLFYCSKSAVTIVVYNSKSSFFSFVLLYRFITYDMIVFLVVRQLYICGEYSFTKTIVKLHFYWKIGSHYSVVTCCIHEAQLFCRVVAKTIYFNASTCKTNTVMQTTWNVFWGASCHPVYAAMCHFYTSCFSNCHVEYFWCFMCHGDFLCARDTCYYTRLWNTFYCFRELMTRQTQSEVQ